MSKNLLQWNFKLAQFGSNFMPVMLENFKQCCFVFILLSL